MKNWKIYSVIITVVLIFVIIGVCVYTFAFRETITEEEAKNIAIEYANVVESDVTILSINKDRGDREYEIRFYDDVYEYEVDVNYNSGRVRNFEKDIRDNINISENTTVSMTEEEARNIALQRVGKSHDEVTFTRIKIDRENGITVYDVYFYDNEKEYELSIDVATKQVVAYKEDYLSQNNSNNNNSNNNNVNNNIVNNNNTITSDKYIGTQRAKEIVLEHAGLTNNDATFSKVELDVDYNLATYEIEFYYNYFEYDYEINAVTGEILKYERGR